MKKSFKNIINTSLIILSLLMLISVSITAQSSADWHDPSNWNLGPPDINIIAIINDPAAAIEITSTAHSLLTLEEH